MRKTLYIVVLYYLLHGKADACFCDIEPRFEAWENAVEVLHVTVEDTKEMDAGDPRRIKYTYNINEIYKPAEPTKLDYSSGYVYIGSKGCPHYLDVGRHYILYIGVDRVVTFCDGHVLRADPTPMAYRDLLELHEKEAKKLQKWRNPREK